MTKYHDPVTLRPSDSDQQIIDAIAHDIYRRTGTIPGDGAILREALAAWMKQNVVSCDTAVANPTTQP